MKYGLRIFASEISYWGSGSLLSIIVPYVTYWSNSSSSVKLPLIYAGDELFSLWGVRRILEGGIDNNLRMGFPFGSSLLDFPDSDGFLHLIIRFIGFFTSNLPLVLNLFYVIGFMVCFISSFVVLRELNIRPILSTLGSLLFAFLPFHFDRIGHLYLTWYFSIPIFILMGLKIYIGNLDYKKFSLKDKFLILALGLMIGSTGVYYSFFGILTILFGALLSLLRKRRIQDVRVFLLFFFSISFGTFLNLLPSFLARISNGKNVEVAKRSIAESEIYGFKLIQLFLPRKDHHLGFLEQFSNLYAQAMPLVNENRSSSLGIAGSLGLTVILIKYLRGSDIPFQTREQIRFLFGLTIFLLTVGITGGLGSIFAMSLTPQIRAWNRIVVFIGFLGIFFFVNWLEKVFERHSGHTRFRSLSVLLIVFIGVIGIYDQLPSVNKQSLQYASSTYKQNILFIDKIENTIGADSAIYQLPYVPFPEYPPIFQMDPYFQLELGFLSKTLKTNVGNVKGTEADIFYRALSKQTLEKQIRMVSDLGFRGIYLDLRAFEDRGAGLEAEFTASSLIQNSFKREDGNVLFLVLNKTNSISPLTSKVPDIRRILNFYEDGSGPRYDSTLESGIDFAIDGFPNFIYSVTGLADNETWGTWADAIHENEIVFSFVNQLPNTFELKFSVQPFTPNIGEKLEVVICNRKFAVTTPIGFTEYSLDVDLKGDVCSELSFHPSKSSSPAELNQSADQRKLSIGFQYLKIISK